MSFTLWCILIGVLLIFMALAGSVLQRLPLTTSLFYLAIGLGLGPVGSNIITLDPIAQAAFLERLTEIAVLISLFTAGLKLRMPFHDPRWWLPLRLAFLAMVITVALIAAAGIFLLHLPLGAAVLLGAILAPTDPVLASDVQVDDPQDRDALRFSLTGEAGLNDGTAFPFVMLGLGLLGMHDLGEWGWRWWVVDLLWATLAGLGIGGLLGTLVARLALYLRQEHREAVGLDDFLALGLIALSYGVALLLHAYGFLAVFAAGLALRRIERQKTGEGAPEDVRAAAQAADKERLATDPEKAPAYMAQAVLEFNEQLERIGEVAALLIVGSLISARYVPWQDLWFLPALFLIIRPVAVWIGLLGTRTTPYQKGLIAWFGIRGIGALYYLMFAIQHGLSRVIALQLTGITLSVIAFSAIVHGISVTPLMERYRRREQPDGTPAD